MRGMGIFNMKRRLLNSKYKSNTTFTDEMLKYGSDITMLAELGKLDPVIGRDKEIEVVIEALSKRRNSNACLVGDAGVGKTAIVHALAIKIAANSVPPLLSRNRVYSIEMAGVVDGAIQVGEVERRVKYVLEQIQLQASEGCSVILFIDGLHNFIKDDRVATILKLALAGDAFKCISTIRVEEYTRYVERDGELKNMFEAIHLHEPSRLDCILMLKGIIPKYQKHHGVRYSQPALVSAVDLSKHYMREICLPGKAINLIDKAGARTRMLGAKTYVTEAEIAHVVSMPSLISVKELYFQTDLEDILRSKIIGQDKAVAAVCGSISRARVRIKDIEETEPIGCFLFTGPTGVGKTEMAKVLAKEYFGSETAMLRLDMRKSMEYQTVSQLLTERVWRNPQTLVLFDDMEKAHEEEVLNLLLQILDGARLGYGQCKNVDFSNTIVIVISNTSEDLKPELVSRFDEVVAFKPLEKEHIEKILEIMIEQFRARVGAKWKIEVEFNKRLRELLISLGYVKRYGARALKRAFTTSVESKLADEILRGRVAPRDAIMFDVSLTATGDVECQVVSQLKMD